MEPPRNPVRFNALLLKEQIEMQSPRLAIRASREQSQNQQLQLLVPVGSKLREEAARDPAKDRPSNNLDEVWWFKSAPPFNDRLATYNRLDLPEYFATVRIANELITHAKLDPRVLRTWRTKLRPGVIRHRVLR
jgi:hypothetical protein